MTRSDAAAGHGPYTQRDHQNQPYQQPGQGPARPSGWNDPYGQSSGSHAAGAPGQDDPAYGAPAEQQYDDGAQQPAPAPSPSRAVRYPDLPDGRPQYGVRLPGNGADTDAGQAAPQQTSAEQFGGQHRADQADAGEPVDQRPGDEQRSPGDQRR
jgi:hypothetical protein